MQVSCDASQAVCQATAGPWVLIGADCCQVVADQVHHHDSGDIQLRTAADGAAQSLLPQQVLAELQQPQEQHLVSHTITYVTALADKQVSHAHLRSCIGTCGLLWSYCTAQGGQGIMHVFKNMRALNRFFV